MNQSISYLPGSVTIKKNTYCIVEEKFQKINDAFIDIESSLHRRSLNRKSKKAIPRQSFIFLASLLSKKLYIPYTLIFFMERGSGYQSTTVWTCGESEGK
ncbi:hypothetical protein ACTFIR_005761 [Dictyostelium discoideum]